MIIVIDRLRMPMIIAELVCNDDDDCGVGGDGDT